MSQMSEMAQMSCLSRLRPAADGDADALFPLLRGTSVTDTILWDGPDSLESFRESLAARADATAKGEQHFFVIVEAETGAPVGCCDLRPGPEGFRGDLGLWIGEPYQGRGYGTAAVRDLLDHGFRRLGMAKIEATVFVGNRASRRIFEKCGFLLEGTIRRAVEKRGRFVDEWLFGILREEHLGAAAADAAAPPARAEPILHICLRDDWEAALAKGEFRAASLEAEGFVHASKPAQVTRVANALFRGREGLVVLWIDPARVRAEIRFESAGGVDRFPHVYGPIPVDAVLFVQPLRPGPDGLFH